LLEDGCLYWDVAKAQRQQFFKKFFDRKVAFKISRPNVLFVGKLMKLKSMIGQVL
jgi:hypothetical protein